MALSDEVHSEFAGLSSSLKADADQVAAVEAAMESLSPTTLQVILSGLGTEIADKKKAAEIVAAAVKVTRIAAPLVALL
jgi:hypothetical protein